MSDCQCELSGFCTARNIAIKPTLQLLCKRDKARVDAHLAGEKPPEKDLKKKTPVSPRVCKVPKEPVGTYLAKRIEGLLGVKAGSGCNCKDLATKMDSWGISKCEKNRSVIVAALVANKDILVKALAGQSFFLNFVLSNVPDVVLNKGANWLLDQALSDVRSLPPVQKLNRPAPPRSKPSATGLKRFIGNLKKEQDRLYAQVQQMAPPDPDPFTDTPIVHFGAHLWPVRGNWQWHADVWKQLAPLVNGKCIVGIVGTDSSECDTFDTVSRYLGDRFQCVELPNTSEGENPTFRILQDRIPNGHNDVLVYCHGKGVRAHTAQSEAVRRWSEAMYETVVLNIPEMLEKLSAGYKNFHSFRTFGVRPLSPINKWHPSGTYFAVRAKHLRDKPVKTRYGGVEAWCGDHFPAHHSYCSFYDNSMFTTLYDHNESRTLVEPMLIEWRRKHNYERLNMCSTWGRNFARQLPEGSVKGKTVVEVGAYDVNGSCRQVVVQQLPAQYIGTDMQAGPGVDVVCSGAELPEKLGTEFADLVICTEVLEHVQDYAAFLISIWSVLKTGGILLLTTRSPGFPHHEYPCDHWRFTWSDMAYMFGQQDILTLTKDPTSDPGVGIIVRKLDGLLLECNPAPAPNP